MSEGDKKMALFAGEHYYPIGGTKDFVRFGTLGELRAEIESAKFQEKYDWAQIVDPSTMGIVFDTDDTDI
jgi:hypothetical protein